MSELLPVRPNLEHLKNQAKAMLRAAPEQKLSDAQHAIARRYGFASWPKLKQHVQRISTQAVAPADASRALPRAANAGDFAAVRAIIESGNFTQHDLDLALARSLSRLEIAQYLVEHGADVNGEYGGNYGPIILAACESPNPQTLKFLINR